ncbi:energy-coupling factor transporter transmembrane component T family protein [Tepidibacillus fermentans]|uniref:Energy-coupling factor transporter transmembrane protein EcfT n=1 Tax=Tepidibacillus fermentans TaxID=1281767 RepID=A0A4R3KE69_9BACI|nr:energy-coupling factor transporter transmembrane component T [Tepidibacillus fermentans]TCS81517.1 energy-coupling factor transport system permease protein [Tepidibacillus fermentans]
MSFSEYLTIGQYIPTHSFLHRLDPRSKLLFVFIYIIVVFFIRDYWGYLLLFLFILVGMIISKIPFSYYWKGLIPILGLILFTIILHLTMTKGGAIYFQWKWFTIYENGVYQAGFVSIRLLLLVFVATMLTHTTSPIDLTMGLEKLMLPLKKFRVPVHELALMMSISLRFIPTLLDETEKIIKAQKARGANFETGPIHRRLLTMVSIVIPLLISAFKRADELATAMEARGYRGEKGRTRLRTITFSWRDLLFFLVFGFVLILLWFLRN